MNNIQINLYKSKKLMKNKILIPHNSKLNNFKSNKYFTLDQNTNPNPMKEALIKYREKNQKTNKNDSISKKSNTSTIDISKINTKQKLNKNNTIKLDKTLLNYAEPRTKVKEFHKIQPKIIDSFTVDTQDNMDSFFENEINNEYDNENGIYEKKGIIYSNVSAEKYNKTIKMQKNKKKLTLSINEFNDNEETIINEYYEEESCYDGFDNNQKQQKTNNDNYTNLNYEKKLHNLTEIKYSFFNKNYLNLNNNDINFEYLLMTEKLFNEFMKDIEINKMEIYQNKLSIIKDFLHIFKDENNNKLYDIIDNMSMNNNINIKDLNTINNCLIIKEYLINQLIFFYTIVLIGLVQKEKNIFYPGILNLCFYFHQNYIVFIYIILTNIKINYKDNDNDNIEVMNNKKKCIEIVKENKVWLDINNYKKYLQNNNNLSKQTVINLLNQLKYYFHANPININKNKKENICAKNNNINQNESIEKCINFFLSNIKSNQNIKITNFIKEINNYSPINYLLELVKFDKILNHYNESINADKDNEIEEFNIENNSIEEMPKEPFLKPINPKYKYTLVLDLDETLVHYISDNESAYIQIRPGAEEFIKELSEYYEIIIFTAALQTYADLVIDGIDPDGVISDRLYRQHTLNVGNTNLKDLEKLGRDIKHVIIIDNFMDNYSLQPKNGLNIIDFEGNEYDDELEYLKEDLLKLVKLNPDDVRHYLNDIQKSMNKRAKYFQKIHNDNINKNELINENDETNNMFNDIIKNNSNTNINNVEEKTNIECLEKMNKKGYSYTEESEIIEE